MILDVRSMYVAGSLTCLILGCVQLSAFVSGRFDRWQAWWGLSNILIGIGTLGIACHGAIPDLLSVKIATVSTLLGYVVLMLGIRAFGGWRPRWAIVVGLGACTMLPPLFLWQDAADSSLRVVFFAFVAVACDAIIVREGLRLARSERLASAWILVGLFSVTTTLFALRAVSVMTGHFIGDNLVSPGAGAQQWCIAVAIAFITLRGNTVLLLAAERDRKSLKTLAERDALTDVSNRVGLSAWVGRFTSKRNTSFGTGIALLLIDIDHFKLLNDTHGHAAGDQVLALLAAIATGQIRDCDTVVRHGGDEFIVVLAGATQDDATQRAEGIRKAFAERLAQMFDITARPTLSVGIAVGDLGSETFAAILEKADAALYRSKRDGRNRIQVPTPVSAIDDAIFEIDPSMLPSLPGATQEQVGVVQI